MGIFGNTDVERSLDLRAPKCLSASSGRPCEWPLLAREMPFGGRHRLSGQ